MNWDAIGAVGEVVGAAAVLVTLGYLALQLRQSARAQSIETYERMMSGYNQLNVARASVPGLAVLTHRGFTHPEQLGEEETVQLSEQEIAMITAEPERHLR